MPSLGFVSSLLATLFAATAAANCSAPATQIVYARATIDLAVTDSGGGSSCSVRVASPSGSSIVAFAVSVIAARLPSPVAQLDVRNPGDPDLLQLQGPVGGSCRQAVAGPEFQATLTTSSATGSGGANASLVVEPIMSGDCPPGWTSSYGKSTRCYGALVANGDASFADATAACRRMRANLAAEFGSIDGSSLVSLTRGDRPHWVGVMEWNGKLYFINGAPFYITLSSVPVWNSCSSDCRCVLLHQNGRFYRGDCTAKLGQLCYAPPGGTNTYYTPDSIGSYVASWSASSSSSSFLGIAFRSYWPAFMAIGLVVVGASVGIRMYFRCRAVRAVERRRDGGGGGVVVGPAAGPPLPTGSYPVQQAHPSPYYPQMQPQPQPPPYSHFNTGYQDEASATTAAAATAGPPVEYKTMATD